MSSLEIRQIPDLAADVVYLARCPETEATAVAKDGRSVTHIITAITRAALSTSGGQRGAPLSGSDTRPAADQPLASPPWLLHHAVHRS